MEVGEIPGSDTDIYFDQINKAIEELFWPHVMAYMTHMPTSPIGPRRVEVMS